MTDTITTTAPDATPDEILYVLQWAETEGAEADDNLSLADDRAQRLEAAATLITAQRDGEKRFVNQIQDEYTEGDAVYDIANHLIEFDRRHGTSRGPIPATAKHWDGPAYKDYAIQEWDAAQG